MTQPSDFPVATPGPRAAGDVIAVHCCEGRFTRAFDELLARVGSPEADRVSIPGGPWWLAEAGRLSKSRIARMAAAKATPARDLLDRYLAEGAIRRIILCGHQDCSWYERMRGTTGPADAIRRQGEDLIRARETIVQAAGQRLSVSGYVLTFDGAGAKFRALF